MLNLQNIEMATFKVLKYNKMIMTKLGMHPNSSDESIIELLKSPFAYYILIVIIGYDIMTSAVFAVANHDHLNNIFEHILVIVASTQAAAMFLNIGLKMKSVKLLHLKLQEFVGKGTLRGNFKKLLS